MDVAEARRMPSLDGLRALSITLVIFSHLLGTAGFPLGERALGAAGDLGYLGVRFFFVISGFLITSLLVQEHERTGRVALGAFYVRRSYRIFPAFLAFIVAMQLADALDAVDLPPSDVVHALTYTMNYHYVRSWELGHLWSLSIEEQFYLIWPVALLLVGPRRIGTVAFAMVIVAPIARVVAWYTMPFRDDVIMEAYPCVMDAIAAGSLLAVVQPRLARSAAYEQFLRSRLFWLVPAVIFIANTPGLIAFDYTIDITAMNVAMAVVIDRCVRVTRGLTFAALNLRPLVWLGSLSYSLYLWQEPFLNHNAHTTITAWPVNVALAIACAIASYYLVERPFLALRDARARRRRAGTTSS